ncbi:MAG TPA: hypothetical protein VKT80_15290, partial [Chloroflexota bacterium]|nr:hypothetical protein [Chloroflexota bacterium]
LIAFWFEPTPERATAYLAALAPVVAELRRREESASVRRRGSVVPDLGLPRVLGHYLLTAVLGAGGDGLVLRAEDTESGAAVAIKMPAYGEYTLAQLLETWHPNMVRIVDSGMALDPPNFWCAMELGDETLDDVLKRQRGAPLARSEALTIFSACCDAVAFLHAHHIYRWSAHQRNVVRVGNVWKITDHGRVCILLDRDNPALAEWREALIGGFRLAPNEAALGADWLLSHHLLDVPFKAGVGLRDPDCERRLRQDDLARLGGLLVDVLGGRRWDYFYRAIVRQPYCSARYRLTGDPLVDVELTAILNRCWRGDAGGAPALANGYNTDQSSYDNPRDLLSDVESAFRH